jgi:ATP-dependent Zn protease
MERKAEMLLQENRDKLEAIALALLEHETLENAEIDRLLEEVEEAQPVPVH